MDPLMLDSNAVAGPVQEVFAVEMTLLTELTELRTQVAERRRMSALELQADHRQSSPRKCTP